MTFKPGDYVTDGYVSGVVQGYYGDQVQIITDAGAFLWVFRDTLRLAIKFSD